jgi:integrating conjugative element protein (TIGR03765 family)
MIPRTLWLGSVLLLATFVAAAPAAGELTVIHEARGSRPITDFMGTPNRRTTAIPLSQPLAVWDVRALLPIHSPGLTPGPVAAREHTLPLAQSFFLIGADALSRAWLVRHRMRLEALGAVGMLVEAKSTADLEAIAELAGGLTIMPASAADVAATLGLKHYPVCITARQLWQ